MLPLTPHLPRKVTQGYHTQLLKHTTRIALESIALLYNDTKACTQLSSVSLPHSKMCSKHLSFAQVVSFYLRTGQRQNETLRPSNPLWLSAQTSGEILVGLPTEQA